MITLAKDKTGRVIEKETSFFFSKTWKYDVISFGWPIEYKAETLISHYPYMKPLIIDIGGRNHYGSQVSIPPEEMNKVIEAYFEFKDIKP